jgi:hypothetical protein
MGHRALSNMQRSTNKSTELYISLFTRWLLHVSARQCHSQGAARFLLSYFNFKILVGDKSWNVWYKPMYRRSMQRTVMVHYHLVVYHHTSLHTTPVHRFIPYVPGLVSYQNLDVEVTQKEPSRSLRMALSCRNM